MSLTHTCMLSRILVEGGKGGGNQREIDGNVNPKMSTFLFTAEKVFFYFPFENCDILDSQIKCERTCMTIY